MSELEVAEQAAVETSSDGASVQDWRSTLPEEIATHRSLENITDVGALAKSYVNAQKLIGADKVVLPGKHATPEERAEFYSKIGRPGSIDDYQIDVVDNTPDNVVNFFRKAAFDSGLTQEQADTFFNNYNDFSTTQLETNTKALESLRDNAIQELKSQGGDAYDDRQQLATATINEFAGSKETANAMATTRMADGTMLGDNPNFVRLMSDIGKFMTDKISEDDLSGMKSSGASTPNEIQAEIAKLIAPNTPYWDGKHPEHEHYVNQALALREQIAEITGDAS